MFKYRPKNNTRMKNIKKRAFTLAEVLITLVVIGVVAAITIPLLIQNHSKHAQYSGFMKSYNTITNMLELSKVRNGNPDDWNTEDIESARKNYIYPYLKYSEISDSSDQNSSYSYDIKSLSGGLSTKLYQLGFNKVIIFPDASILSVIFDDEGIVTFGFDINGPKGPNILGRDFFLMDYKKDNNGVWGFDMDSNGDYAAEDCNTTSGLGQGCSTRLLKEGKMNY